MIQKKNLLIEMEISNVELQHVMTSLGENVIMNEVEIFIIILFDKFFKLNIYLQKIKNNIDTF